VFFVALLKYCKTIYCEWFSCR